MPKKKRVLVYPCGTEIGLEIYRALCFSTKYELIGGSCNYDHGSFVYKEIIENLPFITDESGQEEIDCFERAISGFDIDFIYPAMDGVIATFGKYESRFKETLIIPNPKTASICRSKKQTYLKLKGVVELPHVYTSIDDVKAFPVFVKPDKGQGAVGARIIPDENELRKVDLNKNIVLEYLPGKEYTVDCFTNAEGVLVYAKGRGRKRIKNGISVNCTFENNPLFEKIAQAINSVLRQKGGWFFQVKEAKDGTLKLLEVAARIAGTSAISRNIGANLPLLTLDLFNGIAINDVVLNHYNIELDRALNNVFRLELAYSNVYIDYDDTVLHGDRINTSVVKFLYQCINNGKRIVLLSKHAGDLNEALKHYRINTLFDKVIHLSKDQEKKDYITSSDSIFIDDSYGERKAVNSALQIPVFDTHMIECLMED